MILTRCRKQCGVHEAAASPPRFHQQGNPLGQLFGAAVKMPASHSSSTFHSNILFTSILGDSRWWLRWLDSCHSCESPRLCSWLLGIWGVSQWMGGFSLSPWNKQKFPNTLMVYNLSVSFSIDSVLGNSWTTFRSSDAFLVLHSALSVTVSFLPFAAHIISSLFCILPCLVSIHILWSSAQLSLPQEAFHNLRSSYILITLLECLYPFGGLQRLMLMA